MITIYNNQTCLNNSILQSWKKSIEDISNYRWLIWIEFKKDFFANYKQSGLGGLWAIILPLVPVSAYIFLGYIRALRINHDMPFVVFIISGMTFWQLIAGGIKSGTNAIQTQKSLISKINMPLIVLFLSKYGNVFADAIIRMIFLVFILIYYRINPGINVVFLPFLLLPILMLSMGLGIILGIFNCINSDVGNITNALLTYGMFISSVIFSMPDKGIFGIVKDINIFGQYIIAARNLVVTGKIENMVPIILSSIISFIIFVFAIKWQHNLQYKVRNIL